MLTDPDRESWIDLMQVCMKGHKITEHGSNSNNLKKRCPKCGEKTITECLNCGKFIPGHRHIPGVAMLIGKSPPEYCDNCGKPFPWTKKGILKKKSSEKKRSKKDSPSYLKITILLLIISCVLISAGYVQYMYREPREFATYFEHNIILDSDTFFIIKTTVTFESKGPFCASEPFEVVNVNSTIDYRKNGTVDRYEMRIDVPHSWGHGYLLGNMSQFEEGYDVHSITDQSDFLFYSEGEYQLLATISIILNENGTEYVMQQDSLSANSTPLKVASHEVYENYVARKMNTFTWLIGFAILTVPSGLLAWKKLAIE